MGDSLCRLLAATGWNVHSEFYYNDAGAQITNLALSVQARCRGLGPEDPAWPQDGYRGEYIRDVASAYLAGETIDAEDRHVTGQGDPEDLEAIREFAVAYLRREQDLYLKAFGRECRYGEKSLETYVGRLRRRMTEAGDDGERRLKSVRGVGYRLLTA